jgi:hypothetical protein
VNLPARLGASLAQRVDEALAIPIIHEDPFAPVTAIHDVINRASIFDPQLAGHDGRVALGVSCINIKNRPLFCTISRTDPISDPISFGGFIYQYQELTLFRDYHV